MELSETIQIPNVVDGVEIMISEILNCLWV